MMCSRSFIHGYGCHASIVKDNENIAICSTICISECRKLLCSLTLRAYTNWMMLGCLGNWIRSYRCGSLIFYGVEK